MNINQIPHITSTVNEISQLANRPEISASQLKGKFDAGASNVKTSVNDVIDDINDIIDIINESVYTKAETEAKIDEKVTEIGAGDMAKSVYDSNNDGTVNNADKVGNKSISELFDIMYPIGSLYYSVNNTAPSYGTWTRYAQGRCVIGVDEDDDDFATSGNKDGAKSVSLTKNQLAQHKHTFTGTQASISGGTTTTFNTGTQSHNHTHSVSVANGGSHSHGLRTTVSPYTAPNWERALMTADSLWSSADYYQCNELGSHSHTITCGTETGTQAQNYGSHYHQVDVNFSHTHTYTPAGSTANIGSGEAHNNLQPYITVYIWRRTA